MDRDPTETFRILFVVYPYSAIQQNQSAEPGDFAGEALLILPHETWHVLAEILSGSYSRG